MRQNGNKYYESHTKTKALEISCVFLGVELVIEVTQAWSSMHAERTIVGGNT